MLLGKINECNQDKKKLKFNKLDSSYDTNLLYFVSHSTLLY